MKTYTPDPGRLAALRQHSRNLAGGLVAAKKDVDDAIHDHREAVKRLAMAEHDLERAHGRPDFIAARDAAAERVRQTEDLLKVARQREEAIQQRRNAAGRLWKAAAERAGQSEDGFGPSAGFVHSRPQ